MADLALQITNNATGQLDAGIIAGATLLTLKVGEGAEFPATTGSDYFYVTLQKADGNWEIVKCTTRAGDEFSVIVRNQDSSTGAAQAFSADDIVSLRPCAQVIEDIITEITAHQTVLYAPSGTKMWFYQNTAPSGWTLDAAIADVLLSVKGGSNDYNANGGTQVGDWDQGTHTHTGPSHTHTTGDHSLSIAELAAHTHPTDSQGAHTHDLSQNAGSNENSVMQAVHQTEGTTITVDTSGHVSTEGAHTHTATSIGSGTAHNHGATDASGTAATGASGTADTWRPDAANGIIATKD